MNRGASNSQPAGRRLAVLSLAALGVVFGDIGTSPLYAFRECFAGSHPLPLSEGNVLGVLSLILWSLILVISIKYLVFILRADNEGEGGILALTTLVHSSSPSSAGKNLLPILLGLFGAALLYSDGMITPAISVLSAVEGLEIITPALGPFIIPATIAILIGLFLFQHHGTASVGAVFGPVTLVWFLVLGILGILNIVRAPGVLAAFNPLWGMRLFLENGLRGFFVLGAVFLVVTGGEALYADMGHFGARPIRLVWFFLVLPSLILNYFGQGALLLIQPGAVRNPFFNMAPAWSMYPIVFLATAATVIASQAVISGAFSLSMQAVHLGFSPRLDIQHTSPTERGQIYLPMINSILMVSCIGLVVGFRSSSGLAAAYGIAVTTTMVITTGLFFLLVRKRWNWSLPTAVLICGIFIVMDLGFFGANIAKVLHGGWFPLLVAGVVLALMTTWKRGRLILAGKLRSASTPVEAVIRGLEESPPQRVPGTAVFMTGNPYGTPISLLHNLKHNKVLHEKILILLVETADVPYVPAARRVRDEELGLGIHRFTLHYGFMEYPDVPEALRTVKLGDWEYREEETTFFLGRETLIAATSAKMALWRKKLFVLMSRNSRSATSFFGLPPNRVVELGQQIEL
ncbi:MAG: potassium transporter Kup [Proteobacteria bacterium]|nr:potassium transporter Kup [Pseudomonadota bacterium]